MTAIAYRDGVMASDSGVWMGDACHTWIEKVAAGPDGSLYGVMGDATGAGRFLEWVRGGALGDWPAPTRRADDSSSFRVLVSRPNGDIEIINCDGVERYRGAPYFAVGAANAVAFGALFAGASAEHAIRAAIEHGNGAHGRVQTIRR